MSKEKSIMKTEKRVDINYANYHLLKKCFVLYDRQQNLREIKRK